MSRPQTSTVAIVEDNSALGQSLRKVIESSEGLSCLGVWTSGEEALKKVDAFRPDVVLMDINLPGISGIEATARIKKRLPQTQIVMVTVYGDHDKIFAALKAGASGYLLKRSSPNDLREAIHDVLSGGAPMSSSIARRIVEAFHTPASEADQGEELSPRENEVLKLVAEGRANKEIAMDLGISVQTVRVHVKHIYEKLHIRSRVEAANWYRETRDPRERIG